MANKEPSVKEATFKLTLKLSSGKVVELSKQDLQDLQDLLQTVGVMLKEEKTYVPTYIPYTVPYSWPNYVHPQTIWSSGSSGSSGNILPLTNESI